MINRYAKGRRFEYQTMHKLEQQGFIAMRTAGSHSPFDIIAINPATQKILLIQCKAGTITDKAKHLIRNQWKELNGNYELMFDLLHKPNKKKSYADRFKKRAEIQ